MSDRTVISPKKPLHRGLPRPEIVVVVLAGALLIVPFVGIRLSAEYLLHRAKQEVREAGLPLDLEEAMAMYAVERSGRDGTVLYERAFELLRDPREVLTDWISDPDPERKYLRPASDAVRPESGQVREDQLLPVLGAVGSFAITPSETPPAVVDAMRRYIDAHEEAIELLIQAGQADFSGIGRLDGPGGEASVNRLRRALTAGYLMTMAVDVAMTEGKVDQGIELFESLFRLGDALADDLSIEFSSTALRICDMAVSLAMKWRTQMTSTEARLRRFEAFLNDRWPQSHWYKSNIIAYLEHLDDLPATFKEVTGSRGRLMHLLGSTPRNRAALLRRMVADRQRIAWPHVWPDELLRLHDFEKTLSRRKAQADEINPLYAQSYRGVIRYLGLSCEYLMFTLLSEPQ
ncbi:MAG: hypothetical protein JJU36_11690 [Phycisphaeraceae bacterium]|nr:hypothetical protein [Phycisphaeraceae bacterium]